MASQKNSKKEFDFKEEENKAEISDVSNLNTSQMNFDEDVSLIDDISQYDLSESNDISHLDDDEDDLSIKEGNSFI